MQTAHADRQTRARGIVVALYRGKVVARWGVRQVGRSGIGGGSPGAHARVREAESWRKLAES